MRALQEQIAGLSPEKRARLQELLLRQGGESQVAVSKTPERLHVHPRPQGGTAPLSFAQRRLWFLEQLEPGEANYNVPLALRLIGELDVESLRLSFAEILQRHEVLRSSLFTEPGSDEPLQRVEAVGELECPLVDLSGLSEEGARDRETRRLRDLVCRRPFDLRRSPLARFALLRLQPAEHLALVNLHHIVSDGWSVGILVREVGTLYQAFHAGHSSPMPPLPIQYADFAAWQRQTLVGDALRRELAVWRERLEGAPMVLELPVDRPRSSQRRTVGAIERFAFPERLAEAARAWARAEGATLFMALLASFAALLSRISRREDLIVGTPVAGRNHVEVEGLIGFFVNLLPLRIDLHNDPSAKELLRRVRSRVLEALAHQNLPFELLVERLEVHRDLGRSPLVQVLLALQNAPDERLDLPGLEAHPEPVDTGTAKYDLSLSLFEKDGGLLAAVEYDASLFDRSTIQRFVGHFRTFLQEASAAPESRLSTILALTPGERHQLLLEWNDTALSPRQDDVIPGAEAAHRLVEHWARATPKAPAIAWDGNTLSYDQLNSRANRLARRLRTLGAGAEIPVAVYLERSPGAVVAALAILKAGGIYLPLDPEHSRERLGFVLEDAAVPLLLTRPTLVEGMALNPASQVLDLDETEASAREESGGDLNDEAAGEHRAYMIYTSGSTGLPKGVAVPHRALVNLLRAEQRQHALTPSDAMLQRASLSFDVGVIEIFWPLSAGARIVLALPEDSMDPSCLVRLIAEEGVTTIDIVPSLLRLMLEEPGIEKCSTLTHLVVGAEAMPPDLPAKLAALLPWAVVENHYGPTEVAVTSVVWRSDGRKLQGPAPIGRPLANLQAHVLDAKSRLLPIGIPGEIHLGGDGLARAYLGSPDLTAERFVPNPFGQIFDEPGGRLYRTGDLGRLLPDGLLEYLSRLDHQVKVRGFRVELTEVESVLGTAPGVELCTVIARPDRMGSNHLVAYVAGPGEGEDKVARLRRHLRERLPDYMVPSLFVLSRTLPLTPSGKVDRRALPDPLENLQGARGDLGGAEGPRTPLEELVAAAWSDVLGIDRVTVDGNFFDLGGHSLLAVQVVTRLRRSLGIELAVRDLFEAPNVAALAARVEVALQRSRGRESPSLDVIPRQGSLPLSFAQERLWLLDRLEPGGTAYNVPVAVRLRGRLNPDVLQRCLEEVARRHEVLRITIREEAGIGARAVPGPIRFPMSLADLRGLSPVAKTSESSRLLLAEARRRFDLERGPLARALLIVQGENEWRLLVHLHHIVTDGWSTGVLIREILALYEALSAGRPSPLSPLRVQYADYAAWQRQWLQSDVLAEDLEYFRKHLAGAPELLGLPTDGLRPAVLSSRGSVRAVSAPLPWIESVERASRRWGATPFMTLLAGFKALAGRLSSQEEIVVGTPVAGRMRPELESLIGFFVNTLVLRTSLKGDPRFEELVGRTRDAALGAYCHQELPFEKLVEDLQPERSLGLTPLFQVMFVLQNAPVPRLQAAGLDLTPEPLEQVTAKFDLTVAVQRTEAGLEGVFEYRTDLFEATSVERWIAAWKTLLQAAVSGNGFAVSELPLLGEPERHQLCWEWNGSCRAYPRESRVEALFSQQALQRPEAVALEALGGRWTYGELESRSNRLGRRLRELGVGPEVAVAVCLERSAEAILALLGILKAGGAYVPIDPGYPAPRQELLVADAQARVLLTRPGLLRAVPGADVQVIDLEEAAFADLCSAEALDPQGWAESLAYVMYTSGSTGRPKGVAVTHRGIVRLVKENDYADLGPEQTWLQLAPLSFDASTLEIWGALLNGGRLVVAPSGLPSLEQVGAWVRHSNVTSLWLTAGLFHQVVEGDLSPLSGLRQLLAGGDVLSAPHVRRALDSLPECTIINGYGPTEATTFTCCHWMDSPSQVHDPVPIGRPIAHGRVTVVDGWGAPAPLGVPGELWIGGDGLARGYQGQAERTAERFVPDPFGASGERLYRTGDLARWRRDGTLDFLGRIDAQLKIRGYRIEPGEIEAALSQLPGVSACAVLAQDDRAGRRLVAHLTGHGDTETVREALRRRLPEYMVPSAFVWLERLPLTPNGKIDRRQLAKQTETPDASPAVFLPPQTPVEELVAGVYADVLGLERVGRNRSFFDLGGHSLLATRVVSRLRSELGFDVGIRTLFEAPTVESLAERMEAARAAARGIEAPPLEPIPRVEDPPASYAQERLWVFEQFHPGTATFHIPFAARIEGEVDPDLLRATLSALAGRQEALRTVFTTDSGHLAQRILPAVEVPLPILDLGGLDAESRERETLRIRIEEAARTFDLEGGPLFRATLLSLGEEDQVLLLTFHHIVFDGWSISVLVRELRAIYEDLREGRSPDLPPLPVQAADHAAWQRRWLQGDVLEAKLGSWRRHLAGTPPFLELPVDRPRPPIQTYRGAALDLEIPEDLADSLRAISRRGDATLFMTVLAALDVFLYGMTGQTDLVVGTPVAGRNRAEMEGLIGFFINMLPIRCRLEAGRPFTDLLRRIREAVLAAYDDQDVSFDRIVEDLQVSRDPSRPPLFQVVLAWQNTPATDLDANGLRLAMLSHPIEVVRYDLHFNIVEDRRRLALKLTYNTDLFERATASRWLADFDRLLRSLEERLEGPIADLVESSNRQRSQPIMEKAKLAAISRKKFLDVKPKTVAVPDHGLVKTRTLGGELPLVVEPVVADVDLASWAQENLGWLSERLAEHGGVLLRGFSGHSLEGFREFVRAVSQDTLHYNEPSTPRTQLAGQVYTSTEYPPEQQIRLHNELSYALSWPMKIFFYCKTAAKEGGETPLADSRQIYQAMDPEVRQRFAEKKVMYVRNFGSGFGLPWQAVFNTDDPRQVEAHCREHGIDFAWGENGFLRTRQVRPAVARHPRTGERVWFNQANVHHVANLPPSVRDPLLAVVEDRSYPLDMNACYGDGTPISLEDLEAVNRAYDAHTVAFPWQQGDILMLDNMLVAHGRAPFVGPRSIAVMMSEPVTDLDLSA
jgi:amino acid adenylation domain-containing protein